MLRLMRWRVFVVVALGLVACRDNPNIDGSKVQASAPSCSAVCGRLVGLCGYSPPDCDDDVDGGYCQTYFDDTMLECMSTAVSCQAAWECEPAPPVDYDAEASTDDAGDDAATD